MAAAVAAFGASFGAATAVAMEERCCTAVAAALAVGMAAAAMFVFGMALVPSIDAVVTKAAGISTAAGCGGIAVPVA